MINEYNNIESQPTTMRMYPQQPDTNDPRWRDVAVRSRTQSHTTIMQFPIEDDGTEIMTVYAGDTIAIIPEVQYQYYVAARIGYHIGWVNFKHVKLLSLKPGKRGSFLEDTRPDTPIHTPDQQASTPPNHRIHYVHQTYEPPQEEETQPTPVERRPPPIAKKDVNRIIDKLKSLGGLFSRR